MRKKILLIEDDSAILEATTLLLEEKGYTVIPIPDPKNIITIILKHKPSLILLDVILAGKDGRDIAKKIKQHISTKKIPIILLSAYTGVDKTYQLSGAEAFIAKPFDIDEFLSKIQTYLL